MNKLDKDYLALLQDILDNGVKKQTRNGEVISVFGRTIRHRMSEGFPLITTKKMYWKGIVTELLWFLRGETNIKFLVDNDCHIWDGDAYQAYVKKHKHAIRTDADRSDVVIKMLEEQLIYTQEDFTNKIKTDNEFAKKWGELGPIYGKQWRSWNSVERQEYWTGKETGKLYIDYGQIDQIANLIKDLKTNPDNRRLIVSAWNVGEIGQAVLPPCHYGFQVYTRLLSLDERYKLANINGSKENLPGEPNYTEEQQHSMLDELVPRRAISLIWNQRSVDTPLGLPFNIASYGLLLEIIAKMVNMVPEELIGNLGDTHIYSNQIDGVKEQLTREPFTLSSLRINTEFWPTKSGECGVGELTDNVDFLIKEMRIDDFQIENYKSHSPIKFPLSN